MKLTILGAASPRFPLLLQSLLRRKIPVTDLVLHDTDMERLQLISNKLLPSIQSHYEKGPHIHIEPLFENAVSDADYIFSSIRVGGQQARMQDERIPLEYGLLGQETTGVGGFSLALRTIPVVTEQAQIIHQKAPNAWIINFTNPAGIVTQAVRRISDHKKIVGICDAPEVITRITCLLYDVSFEDVEIQYFGLNHLGWVYSIKVHGREILGEIINNRLDEFIEKEPFYAGLREYMISTQLIPNEYLFYYINPDLVARNQQKSSIHRAAQICELDRRLYNELLTGTRPAVESFNAYMTDRESSYMAGETGYQRSIEAFNLFAQNKDWGYDAVALSVLESLAGRSKRTIIINTSNSGFHKDLKDDDTVEVSSCFHNGQFKPVGTPPDFPPEVMKLLTQMKRYENTLVEAAACRDWAKAVNALSLHPLVKENMAEPIAKEIHTHFKEFLEYYQNS